MATVTPNYSVNYNDPRFREVETDKRVALSEAEAVYGGMINATDRHYNNLINESKAWAEEQKKQQQAQTDFAIEKVEQNKAQANKEYIREQSGAYVDWQKQSNKYGANAEQMAASGLQNTGYSESSQVSMYNTYQNRVATARESYNLAIMNYDNAIKDAMLQNSAALAQIAHDALKAQLKLSLEGFQYENELLREKANKKLEIDNMYHNRYQDVLAQINQENALKEEARRFNLEYEEGIRQFNEEIARLKAKDEKEYETEIKKLELEKDRLEEEKRQFDAKNSGGGSGGGGGGGGKIIVDNDGNGSGGSGGNVVGNNSNIKLDPKSRARVEKFFGKKFTDAELAKHAASGAINMYISGDTAYFSIPARFAKQKDLMM